MKAPLSQYPGMNPFVLDWLAGDERFLPRASHWAEGLARSSQLAARSRSGGGRRPPES